ADGKHHFYYVSSELLRDGNRVDGLKCMLRTAEQKKTSAFTALGQETRYTFDSIIGESKKLCELKRVGESAAQNASNVLILGESGTGKEMVAQAIHAANGDRKGPFVPINCAALPKELLSSELFGYEEGAFTGALKGGHAGKFEQADGGTVFLDEIAEMPLEMQSALLRVLEDGVVSRIGGKRYIPLDVRVIAATNKDLWSCVQQGSFRTDLYFRLNIVSIRLPPLRERLEDMKMLVEHLLGQLSEKGMSRAVGADEDVLGLLCEYNWPGNVRELRNVLERSANAAGSDTLTLETIPADIIALLTGAGSASAGEMPRDVIVDVASWRRSDKDRIAALMGKYNGNKSKVASELGVSRGTLYKRLREFGLED
ncbi:MAG: sigma 54-interacting transcriptional regulator, partial [Oscillospiraceae bacterium]